MCLILLAYKTHPEYPLIIAANRDEFYERKTHHAHFWEDHEQILAGRDLEAGGTWMGITRAGKVAMLTNYRDLKNIKESAPSRGHLVSDFLKEDLEAEAYLREIETVGRRYNGFNLICGSVDQLYYYGNFQEGVHEIEPGIHGLSNALMDTPWPKVERGKKKLSALIHREQLKPKDFLEVLYDDIKAPDDQLPDTGVGIEMERMLSPMFIKSPNYGSRCSTVVMLKQDGSFSFLERTYDREGSHKDYIF